MNSFLINSKQNLMVFGIYVLLFIYSIYLKIFEKTPVQKNSKVSSKKGKNTKKNSNSLKQGGFCLNLFYIIDNLNNQKLFDKLLSINPNVVNHKDKNGNTPLMLSIIHNRDESMISKLLSFTSDINIKNNNGDNCLMLAIQNYNKKIVDLILQTNINVNSQNVQGENPLLLAITKGYNDIVISLLNKNVNLNIRNKDGKIPIEIAIANGNLDLIKTLIEYGATTLVKDMNDEYIIFELMSEPTLLKDIIEVESKSPNKKNLILTLRNKQGYTLFMEFCRLGCIKLAKFMIKNKADLNCVSHGETALTLAVREGQLDIVKLLLTCRSIDVHHITNDNKTPLRIAIENEDISMVKTLIDFGGPLLLKNENENLLKNAINTSNIEIINLLLDININVDIRFGPEKNTPLIYTIKKILKDMNIDTSDDEFNKSSLYSHELAHDKEDDDHMSTSSSNSSEITLAHHKSISITDNNYYSRVFSNMEIEDDHGMDGDVNDSSIYDSDDTLSNAEEFDDSSTTEQDSSFSKENSIEEINNPTKIHDSKKKDENLSVINTDIPILNHKTSFEKHFKAKDTSIKVDDHYCDIIKSLLHYNAKVNIANNSKDTALILACRYGLKNVVEMILNESHQLNLDLDINMMDRYGNTALHNACKKNYTSVVRFLLSDDSINVNIQNQNGNSALMIAVYENNLEIIHELLECENININTLNIQLETPLIAACRMNNYKVAKLLIENKAIINKRYDLNGETAIFHSVRNNNKKLTSLLLDNDASVSFKNKNGKSPLNIAKEYKYKGIVSLLFSHFKNINALKSKTSTSSLNENLIRSEDKKAFFNNKSHSRNASLNISNLNHNSTPSNSSGSPISPLSLMTELKNSNKPSLEINHSRNNSVTFNKNLVNSKHTRHESFNEGNGSSKSSSSSGSINGRFNNHKRHKSLNPELLSNKIHNIEKFAKSEISKNGNVNLTSKDTITTTNATTATTEKLNEKENHDMKDNTTKKTNYELKHAHSCPTEFHKKKSNSKKMKSKSKYGSDEDNDNDGEESDTEITTNLLIMKAKEKIQNDANAEAHANSNLKSNSNSKSKSNANPNANSTTSTTSTKSLKHSKSLNSMKGEREPKPDDYLKPLKTACYNQNLEDVKKFYENLVQEKGNIYQLPDELFQEIKNCKNEKEREAVTQKIKDYNKKRSATPTTVSLDMFAFTLLFFSDNADAIETMLQYGLNPNMQNNAQYTLLILACKKCQPKSALVLLDYNADPNYQNKYDESALILACKKGLDDVIEKLLQCHANVNLRNDKGETALNMACWKKNLKIVRRLLETDVDVNMKNNLEESPLFLSCLQNNLEIAEALLKKGADVNTCNKNNETPLMIARKNNNEKLIELLLKYGAKDN